VNIEGEDYAVSLDDETKTVTCEGSLRLSGMTEYAPIVALLNELADTVPPTVTLDVRKLKFLNSSGINALSKFVIKVRKNEKTAMFVKGSKSIAWQKKSLKNLQRLMPNLELQWE